MLEWDGSWNAWFWFAVVPRVPVSPLPLLWCDGSLGFPRAEKTNPLASFCACTLLQVPLSQAAFSSHSGCVVNSPVWLITSILSSAEILGLSSTDLDSPCMMLRRCIVTSSDGCKHFRGAFLFHSPREESSIPDTTAVESVLLCPCLEGAVCGWWRALVCQTAQERGPCAPLMGPWQWNEAFQDGIMGHPWTKTLFRLSCRKEEEESSTTNPGNWISGFEQPGSCKDVNLLPEKAENPGTKKMPHNSRPFLGKVRRGSKS